MDYLYILPRKMDSYLKLREYSKFLEVYCLSQITTFFFHFFPLILFSKTQNLNSHFIHCEFQPTI